MLPLLARTHCWCVVNGALGGYCQAFFHHAGKAVELMLLINLKQAQEFPLLPQTSPSPPLHHAGGLTVARDLKATGHCWHLHLRHRKIQKI